MGNTNQFQIGDPVIYMMTKQSSHPTLRATKVSPSAHGDQYNYVVEKFWVVSEITEDGNLIVQTRRGKSRELSKTDPNLKRANWWHRWLYRNRFPEVDAEKSEQLSA